MTEENAFVRDLCKAQSEMKKAIYDKVNPHFKSKYASLGAVYDAVLPALNRHGFVVVEATKIGYDTQGLPAWMVLVTELAHISGESRFSEYIIVLSTPQQQGSNETYGRRYNLSALTCNASEEDDDAELAQGGHKSAAQSKRDRDYEILTEEITAQRTTADLRAWGLKAKDRIHVLRSDWQELVRDAFAFRLKELGGNEGPPSKIHEDLKASLALTEEEQEEIDPPDFLNDLDSQMKDANDEATVMEIWKEFGGILENLPTADQHQAQGIFERHMRGLKATSAVKAMKAARK